MLRKRQRLIPLEPACEADIMGEKLGGGPAGICDGAPCPGPCPGPWPGPPKGGGPHGPGPPKGGGPPGPGPGPGPSNGGGKNGLNGWPKLFSLNGF